MQGPKSRTSLSIKPSTTVGTMGEAMAGLGGLLGDWAESATVATVGLSETVKETVGASMGRSGVTNTSFLYIIK